MIASHPRRVIPMPPYPDEIEEATRSLDSPTQEHVAEQLPPDWRETGERETES
jgi:hypothetical protein